MEPRERVARVKAFLRSRPNVPCNSAEIKVATGVPKALIDHRQLLSADPEIRREMLPDLGTGRTRTFWRYVGPGGGLEEPSSPIVFGPWARWSERSLLSSKIRQQAGVYLLARFESAPDPDTTPSIDRLPKEVIYVGMSKNLVTRPIRAHRNGTDRYREIYRDLELEHLYVSVHPVYPADSADRDLRYRFVQYLEMKIQWEYTRQHGRSPDMHFKKPRAR